MRPDPASPVASSERTATFVYRTAGLVSEQAVRVQPGPDLPRGKVEWTSIKRHVRNSAVSFQVGKCFEGHPVPGSRKSLRAQSGGRGRRALASSGLSESPRCKTRTGTERRSDPIDKSSERWLSLKRSWQQGHSTPHSTTFEPSRLQGIHPDGRLKLSCAGPDAGLSPTPGCPPGMLLGRRMPAYPQSGDVHRDG